MTAPATHPAALPHWGAASADLIYEMPIQADGSTRELALFMGDCPDGAGPVRSARVPMCSLREMWGGVFAFFRMAGFTFGMFLFFRRIACALTAKQPIAAADQCQHQS